MTAASSSSVRLSTSTCLTAASAMRTVRLRTSSPLFMASFIDSFNCVLILMRRIILELRRERNYLEGDKSLWDRVKGEERKGKPGDQRPLLTLLLLGGRLLERSYSK